MSNVVEAIEVCKSLGGKQILKGINLNLEKGKVLGILGPNGQGKTTFLNVLAGFLKIDNGSAKINGVDVGVKTKASVSFLQEKSNLCNWMTIADSIDFYNDFFEDFDEEKANNLLESMKLDRKSKVKSLSKGML